MRVGKHGRHTIKGDNEMLRLLESDKDKQLYTDFVKDASTHNPSSDWGKEIRASAKRDLMTQGMKDAASPVNIPFSNGLEDYVIAKIDAERGVSEESDIAPGIIKTPYGYRCSVGTPKGYEKDFFHTQTAAEDWVASVRKKYEDFCV